MPVPVTGQVNVTGTAQAVSATAVSCSAYEVKAPQTNLLPVYIGPAGVTVSTGHQLDPGTTFGYEKNSQHGQTRLELGPGDLFVVGTAPDKITWFASPSTQS